VNIGDLENCSARITTISGGGFQQHHFRFHFKLTPHSISEVAGFCAAALKACSFVAFLQGFGVASRSGAYG